MKQNQCQQCKRYFPMNETLKIAEHIVCRDCAQEFIESQQNITQEMIQPNPDPTVCIQCGTDYGDVTLNTMAGVPTCDQCRSFFKNRPFPTWIKVSFAGLIAVVLFSFIWNFRFITAYVQMRQSVRALVRGDMEEASTLMTSVSEHVPEDVGLRAGASFYKGLYFLQQEKDAEALSLFKSCRGILGPRFELDYFITIAEIGVAFDNKDYDKFLKLALELRGKRPNDPIILAQVASAYACKYAVTGDEQIRLKGLEALDKARAASGQDADFGEYEQRILHRFHTREIINRGEFKEKYPDGWKPPEEE
ncbi:MAG: tetratricopeptide repeat protein [Planctomycetota bacterium]